MYTRAIYALFQSETAVIKNNNISMIMFYWKQLL